VARAREVRAASRRWGGRACSRAVCSAVLHDQHLPVASIVWHRGLALLATNVRCEPLADGNGFCERLTADVAVDVRQQACEYGLVGL
jgi:hypothetical protein